MKKTLLLMLLVLPLARSQQITVNNVQPNSKQGNGTRFQLSGSVSNSAGLDICTDSFGNTTTTGCASYESPITSGSYLDYWRGDKSWQVLNSSVVPEGYNLYFTPARVIAVISSYSPIYFGSNGAISCPTCLVSGTTYTDPSWLILSWGGGHITGIPDYQLLITPGTTSEYYRGDKTWQTLNTSIVPEGTNQYYTDPRARAAFSASGQLTYNSTTGVFGMPFVELALTAGTSAQYYRGDKTWQTLNTDIVPQGTTNLYFTSAAVLSLLTATVPITTGAGVFACSTCLTTTGGQTIGGTETFNNVVINGTCTGTGCSSGGGPGTPGGISGQIQWNNAGTFGGFTMSGDATLIASTGALTLSTVNTSSGVCGDATHSCQITTNAKGLVTTQIQVGIAGAGGTTPGGTSGQVQYNVGGTSFGGFTVSGDFTLNTSTGAGTLTTVNSGPGACGDSTHVCQVTTNGKGLVTAQSAIAISGSGGGTPGGTNGQLQYNNSGAFGGFTAGGDLTFSQPNFTLATVNTSVGACGDSTHYAIVTLNAKGLTTACSTGTIPSLSNTPLLTASNTYTSGSSSNLWQGSNGYVVISTATNALIGAFAGTGGTASAFYFSAIASTTPSIDVQVGTTIYSGVTSSGCSSFVAGVCVVSGSASGTVTSIATTNPIAGGTITTSGTISCPTCLTTAGGQTISGSETFSGVTNLFTVNQLGLFGRVVNFEPNYQDEPAALFYGYTGGSDDLIRAYNQVGGNQLFAVTHTGNLVIGTTGGSGATITRYGGFATNGMGVPPIYAAVDYTNVASSFGPYSLNCGGTICPAGLYRACAYGNGVTGSGTGTVVLALYWTDQDRNRAVSPWMWSAAGTSDDCFNVYTTGSVAIQYALSVTGAVTSDLHIALERLQ